MQHLIIDQKMFYMYIFYINIYLNVMHFNAVNFKYAKISNFYYTCMCSFFVDEQNLFNYWLQSILYLEYDNYICVSYFTYIDYLDFVFSSSNSSIKL